jgi:hypothetical protein
MQPNDDPRKRPLLTAEQLQTMRKASGRPKKGTPRQEFENLFRLAPSDQRNVAAVWMKRDDRQRDH